MRGARYLLVTAALAGCGHADQPDTDAVTNALARDVAQQTGTPNVNVVCRDGVSEGDLCDVSAEGGLKAKVRIASIDGDDVEGEVVQP
jgi:hypothetical protein